MKHFKKLLYLLIAMLMVISCEKETSDSDILDVNAQKEMTFEQKLDFYNIDLDNIGKNESNRVDPSGAPIYTLLCEDVNTGVAPVGGFFEDPDNFEYYYFYGNQNDVISIEVVSGNFSGDLVLSLYYGLANSTTGIYVDNGGNDMQFLIWDDDDFAYPYIWDPYLRNYTLPYTGFYTVAISSWYSLVNSTTPYDLITTGITCPDTDGDGIYNFEDNCPDMRNAGQADRDGDGVGNRCDNCPSVSNVGQADADGDGVGDACDICPGGDDLVDTDRDYIPDDCDNCPDNHNADQADTDGDGIGDMCDPFPNGGTDSDGDGVIDAVDNCPSTPNPYQYDVDGDGIGDACDACPLDPENDADGDGVCESEDNCPDYFNPSQLDSDGDGIGDGCDDFRLDPDNDIDGDGTCGIQDNCPTTYNPGQEDADSDGVGDACDDCPFDANDDIDGDGICGDVDNCPDVYNPDQLDTDGDGMGDVCDGDDDNDKVLDVNDNCPTTFNPHQNDYDGDGIGDDCDDDDDNDGKIDANDKYPRSNISTWLMLDCKLRITNQLVRPGVMMNDEIQNAMNIAEALVGVSDARRTSKFRAKMYTVVTNWWFKYKLIDNSEKQQILNCVNGMSYPFNEPM